ncbi:hypothetical protein ABOM_007908 [Aspergillus bombycis]|uniref:Zn(2)-C6 fungal-type domain-containing protein n=1 Tax=Aspergillus bombycis TaxID=109264 RepID=A0A1F7ZSB0_9EURO|nr:hypothetical protein ABOM_007908 [Aspergillus bombycis]OGM42351.1 hypothetical protein ABOM_007908 [Aspergillus bombycis]
MESRAHRKRRRVQFSCAECHRRKVRCDRNDPCGRCSAAEIRCVYAADRDEEAHYLTEVEARDNAATKSGVRRTAPITNSARSLPPSHQQPFSSPATKQRDDSQRGVTYLRGRVSEVQRDGNESVDQRTIHGVMSKARLLGTTHPIATYRQCDEMYPIDFNPECRRATETIPSSLLSEVQGLIASSKATARCVKNHQTPAGLAMEAAVRSLPARDVCDKLVEHYLRIVELPFRILHIPNFRREYSAFWDESSKRRPLFVVIVLLILSIGVQFSDEKETDPLQRQYARQWIRAAQAWLSDIRCKDFATISGIQAHCLVVLSLQFNGSKPDRIWLAQGVLQRIANYMGLHRDPTHFPEMPLYHAEMRRRLWSTIMEFEVQVSMDLGMLPNTIEFDTTPPSNLDDEAFEETTTTCPKQAPTSTQTQSSLQIHLRRSLAARITIARLMNDTFTEPSYDDVLKETNNLARIITASEASLHLFTVVHRNLINFLTRRFLLALHRPFATKALQDPRYYYSRKVCLDNALLLLTPEPDWDFNQMLLVSIILFRHIMHHAAIVLCVEVVGQIKEDQSEKQLLQLRQDARGQLLSRIRRVLNMTEKRLHEGETNVKSYVFLHMAIAQIEAMEQGMDVAAHVLKAATMAAREALDILQQQSGTETQDLGYTARYLGSEFDTMLQDDSVPLTLTELSNAGLSFGDMASWIFSDSMDEYPL